MKRSIRQKASIGLFLFGLFVIAAGIGLIQFAFTTQVGVCQEMEAQLTPISNDKAMLTIVCKHTVDMGSYSFNLIGSTYYSNNAPNYPNTGYAPYEIVSSSVELPKWCKLSYDISAQCQSAAFETVEDSLFTSYGRDYPVTFYGQDWRVAPTGEESFAELVNNNKNYDKFPAPTATSAWQNTYDGKTVFFVMQKEIPIALGKDTYVSIFYLDGVVHSIGEGHKYLFPQCACAYQGIGNPIAENYDMTSVPYILFGPCGTEIPARNLDPVSGSINVQVTSGTGIFPSTIYDYGKTIKISKVELSQSGDFVTINDASMGVQYSTDNSTWNTLYNLPQGWSQDEKEFEAPVEARYIKVYGKYDYTGQTWRGPYTVSGSYKVYALNPEYEEYYKFYETHQCEFSDTDPNPVQQPKQIIWFYVIGGFIILLIAYYIRRH